LLQVCCQQSDVYTRSRRITRDRTKSRDITRDDAMSRRTRRQLIDSLTNYFATTKVFDLKMFPFPTSKSRENVVDQCRCQRAGINFHDNAQ